MTQKCPSRATRVRPTGRGFVLAVLLLSGCGLDFDAPFSEPIALEDASAGGAAGHAGIADASKETTEGAVGEGGLDGDGVGGMDSGSGGLGGTAGASGAGGVIATGGTAGYSGSGGAAGTAGAGGVGGTAGASCPPKSVQQGNVSLTAGTDTVTAAIKSVDPSHSFLLFGTRFSKGLPKDSQVTGRLQSSSQLSFARHAGNATIVDIHWYVVEFPDCVTVQRGSAPFNSTDTAVALSSPVDLTRSFPLLSYRAEGDDYNMNDTIRATLSSPTTLSLTASKETSSGIVEWQVVSMDYCVVTSGNAHLAKTEPVAQVAIPAVDVTKTWLVFNYSISEWTGSGDVPTANLLLTGRLPSGNQILFERGGAGAVAMDIAWYAVSFTDGTRVNSGQSVLHNGLESLTVSLGSADPMRTVATANGYWGRCGSTTDPSAEDVGVGSVTLEVLAGTTETWVSLQRGSTLGAAQVRWTALEFP